jgi:O-antigen ligase
MHTISDTSEGTASGRIESWKAAWKMFLDYPFGVGGGNFPVRFPDYQTSYFTYNMWGRAAHSLWFTIIPELGIFGVIIYLLLIYYNFTDIAFISKVNQNYNQDSVYLKQLSGAFLASFAGFFISGTFLSVLYYPHFWYLTGILVAAKKISQNLSVQQTSDSIRPSLGVRRKAELSGRLA